MSGVLEKFVLRGFLSLFCMANAGGMNQSGEERVVNDRSSEKQLVKINQSGEKWNWFSDKQMSEYKKLHDKLVAEKRAEKDPPVDLYVPLDIVERKFMKVILSKVFFPDISYYRNNCGLDLMGEIPSGRVYVVSSYIKECPPLAVIDIGTALKINGLYVVHVKSAADMPPLVFSCPGFTNIEMAILQAAVAVPGGWSISKGTLNGIYKEAVQRWDRVNNLGYPICILGFFDRLKVGNRLDINRKIIEIREYFFNPNLWIRRQVKMGRIKMGRKGRLSRFNRNRPRHCVNTHITIPD